MRVVIVSGLKYPEGDAGSVRQHAFAKALLDARSDVFVVGYGTPTPSCRENDGVSFVSLREPGNSFANKIKSRLFFLGRMRKILHDAVDVGGIIAMSGLLPRELRFLKRFADNNDIPFVLDAVEYYSPEEFSHPRLSFHYRDNIWCNESFVKRGDSVIAISRFLEKHFQARGANVVRIPVVLDVSNVDCRLECSDGVDRKTFVYAGLPGKKDYLETIVKGFSLLDQEARKKCMLKLVGVTKTQLIESCGVDAGTVEDLGDALCCVGRVSRKRAAEAVRLADYTLFLRPNLRYANAGFPTKFVESLACGTPVITNLSSDLGDYHEEYRTGIVVSECSSKALAEAIERALSVDKDTYFRMRVESREAAERFFDYRRYSLSLLSLFENTGGVRDV